MICVSQINNQTALFLPADEYEVWKKETEADFYGVSLPARGFEECKRAFEQAEKARKSAFVTGKRCCIYKETEFSAEGLEKEAEQFVQQFSGTGRNAAVKKLLNRCFQARHGEESPEKILLFLTLILKKLEVLCRNLIERKEILDYEEPLIWDTLEQYEGYLKTWLDRLGECMEEQFSCDQNKRKILQFLPQPRTFLVPLWSIRKGLFQCGFDKRVCLPGKEGLSGRTAHQTAHPADFGLYPQHIGRLHFFHADGYIVDHGSQNDIFVVQIPQTVHLSQNQILYGNGPGHHCGYPQDTGPQPVSSVGGILNHPAQVRQGFYDVKNCGLLNSQFLADLGNSQGLYV